MFFLILGGGLTAVIYIDVVQVLIMIDGSSALLFRGTRRFFKIKEIISYAVFISII